MAPKKYRCSQCNKTHKKPIDEQCPSVSLNDSVGSSNVSDQQQNHDIRSQILAELQKLNGRIATVEKRVQTNAQKLSYVMPQAHNVPVTQHQAAAEASNSRSRHSSSADALVQSQDVLILSLSSLQTSQRIHVEVDERLRHLAHLSMDQGKLKSQRGGGIFLLKNKYHVPQNHILGGQSKARVSYDGLSWCQWMAGFATIAREESDLDTKNAMLEYLADLMEDANDFSWASAKGSHAMLLCKMEEGKLQWSDTLKIDRIRRAHAQRFTQQNQTQNSQKKRTARECLANFTKRAHASTKQITTRVQSFISTFDQSVPPRAKNTGTQQKIAGYLVQKTNQALQNCSAKFRKSILVKRSYGTGQRCNVQKSW